jgi:hypothetical protein
MITMLSSPDEQAIRLAVDRLFRDGPFAVGTKDAQFLRYVMENRGAGLSEATIRAELYKDVRDNDNRVRQLAVSVRRKLQKYYNRGGAADPVEICFEKHRYSVAFRWRNPPADRAVPVELHLPTKHGEQERFTIPRSVWQRYISLQRKECRDALLEELGAEGIEPFGPPQANVAVPFLGTVLQIQRASTENVLMLPSGAANENIEGAGRTSVVVRSIGMSIPYAQLLAADDSELPSRIEIRVNENPGARLIASDMAILDASTGVLLATPTKVERLDFVWDMARHLFRYTQLNYHSGEHRDQLSRLVEIIYRLPFDQLRRVFTLQPPPYRIHRVVIVTPTSDQRQHISWYNLDVRQARAALPIALSAGTEHLSRFWRLRAADISSGVHALFPGGAASAPPWEVPPVHEAVIPRRASGSSRFLFDEVAQHLLDTPDEPVRRPPVQLPGMSGVRFHNDTLIGALRSGATGKGLDLVLTSGESLFSEVSFWNALLASPSPPHVTALLFDPGSRNAREWAAVRPGERTFSFADEVARNVRLLQRFASKCPAGLSWGFYRSLPNFKMTFFGDRVLVGCYDDLRASAAAATFYEADTAQSSGMYNSFRHEFERIKAECKLTGGTP